MKGDKKVPFSLEVKISDENGNKIFEWRYGRGNLLLGLRVTERFVMKKLGIDRKAWKEQYKRLEEANERMLGVKEQ